MLGIEPQVARGTWTAFLVVLAIGVAYVIRGTLVVFALALLFAYLLTPLVGFVRRQIPARFPRNLALAIVYLGLMGVLVGAFIAIGLRIGQDATNLASKLPQLVQENQDWQTRIPLPRFLEPFRDRFFDFARIQIAERGHDFVPYLQRLGARVALGARYAGYLILIPILAFFFLKDGPAIRNALLSQFPDGRPRLTLESIANDIDRLLGQYIRALVLQALSAFAFYGLFLSITGAPYAVLLAGLAGPLEFIPVVGPLTAGAITALVAGLAGYTHFVSFAIFWVMLRVFQDYVLIPFLLGAGIEMDPLLVLFGVLAGEQIAGIEGMFFSVPVLAILRVIFVRLRRSTQIEAPEGPQ